MKKHEIILNMINDFFIFWSNHCDHSNVWRLIEKKSAFRVAENSKTSSMRQQMSVEIKVKFEEISSVRLSITIFKRNSSLSSNVKNEIETISLIERKIARAFKIKRISKIKQTTNNFRSKDFVKSFAWSKECFASFDMTFIENVVYNLLSKQKNVELFVIFFKNIDD